MMLARSNGPISTAVTDLLLDGTSARTCPNARARYNS